MTVYFANNLSDIRLADIQYTCRYYFMVDTVVGDLKDHNFIKSIKKFVGKEPEPQKIMNLIVSVNWLEFCKTIVYKTFKEWE